MDATLRSVLTLFHYPPTPLGSSRHVRSSLPDFPPLISPTGTPNSSGPPLPPYPPLNSPRHRPFFVPFRAPCPFKLSTSSLVVTTWLQVAPATPLKPHRSLQIELRRPKNTDFIFFEMFLLSQLLATKMVPRGGKMVPRGPQEAPRWPQELQDSPKMAPRWPKMASRWPKMLPRWPKIA